MNLWIPRASLSPKVKAALKTTTTVTRVTRGSIHPSGSFIRLTDGKITSKKRMPGILQLQSDEPWEWGQTLADWQDENHALVINSEKARKQEQVHMHVCPVFAGSTNPPRRPVQDTLSDLTRSDYTSLKAVPGRDWLCKVEPTKYAHFKGVTSEIQSKTASLPDGCKCLVGAAVVVDKRDYTWLSHYYIGVYSGTILCINATFEAQSLELDILQKWVSSGYLEPTESWSRVTVTRIEENGTL
ncbi:hypothetical protein N7520_002465 [Penicillium odoratum]|uniref:uncharacterized protein n=1 Tax=Penicillium odoratum TaxID=1167516 RepID=UPI002547871C|nr:uncharacterized protein N7520_002465 [Penicillium odoratum]KAJ5771936.1 hypothetical protein N7520_002465 [Penicillium odoratum]